MTFICSALIWVWKIIDDIYYSEVIAPWQNLKDDYKSKFYKWGLIIVDETFVFLGGCFMLVFFYTLNTNNIWIDTRR